MSRNHPDNEDEEESYDNLRIADHIILSVTSRSSVVYH